MMHPDRGSDVRCGGCARDQLIESLRLMPSPRRRRTALAAPESFASIADNDARSAALFTELGKVLTIRAA